MRTTDVVEKYWFFEANYMQAFADVHLGPIQLGAARAPDFAVVKSNAKM